MYGYLEGSKEINGKPSTFIYYTQVSEVNCYLSNAEAENQVYNYFKNIIKNWDEYTIYINRHNSFETISQIKNERVLNTKESARKNSQYGFIYESVRESNAPMNFYCNN